MLPSLHMLLMFLTLTRFCLKSHPLPKKPLRAITTSSAPVPLWTSETGRAFADLRVALQQPPCLGLPDPTKPFVQTVCDKSGTMSSRADLSDVPLTDPEFILFVDGSASLDPDTGKNRVGFAVCSPSATLVSSPLPSHLSAQEAELIALMEACMFAAGQSVTIYTNSHYAFGEVHDFGTLRKQSGFLTSSGSRICNSSQVAALLEAILFPSAIAVCEFAAHTGGGGGG